MFFRKVAHEIGEIFNDLALKKNPLMDRLFALASEGFPLYPLVEGTYGSLLLHTRILRELSPEEIRKLNTLQPGQVRKLNDGTSQLVLPFFFPEWVWQEEARREKLTHFVHDSLEGAIPIVRSFLQAFRGTPFQPLEGETTYIHSKTIAYRMVRIRHFHDYPSLLEIRAPEIDENTKWVDQWNRDVLGQAYLDDIGRGWIRYPLLKVLGEPLPSYAERVMDAVDTMLIGATFTPWLLGNTDRL